MTGSAMDARCMVRTMGMVAVDGHVSHSPRIRRASGHAVCFTWNNSLWVGVSRDASFDTPPRDSVGFLALWAFRIFEARGIRWTLDDVVPE